MGKRNSVLGVVGSIITLVAVLAGCGGSNSVTPDSTRTGERPLLVVTHSILASIVEQVVGDDAEVRTLIADGTDPHEYAPTAREIEALSRADLIIRNGGGFDQSLDRVIKDALIGGVPVFNAFEHVSSPPEGVQDDPHFFTDPQSMRQVIEPLAAEISNATTLDLSERAAALVADLDKVASRMATNRARLDSVNGGINCVLITGHESLAYIASRYECSVLGAVIPGQSSSAEATASDLARLKDIAAINKVGAIFVESTLSSRVAEQLADELGVDVVTLDVEMLGNARSYQEYVESLMTAIVEGLLPS